MFVRRKIDRRGRPHHQLVQSLRHGPHIRQRILAYLGDAGSIEAALVGWPAQIVDLRDRAVECRVAAERLKAQMPPPWMPHGVVPRPSRWGMRLAQKRFGQYWMEWDRAEKLDRAADRLQRRLDRLRDLVEHELGTTLNDDELLRDEA